ncbi:GNAT family N-acetyltransferase [Paenibacillus ginsengarvi]|uniref:N-acetyltransferase n=1 Tax=Paenibacillus ginsengarvi TaxID=400777 RepID=A0A3B0BLF1_9BACL|nr:GNAT family N-acetyltransferase [Paenibacillus ginsengarvi]RKN72994.1 N-acetyltransferase [Paenibacillus ginsengarvi]
MLIDIKPRLREAVVADLIGQAVFPDPEAIARAITLYESSSDLELYGLEFEGELVGAVGIAMRDGEELVVKHIAVLPDQRGKGFGRDLMVALIPLKNPRRLVAETDEESVDFYRSIGFTIESLGEKYPGVERFQCTYEVDEEE